MGKKSYYAFEYTCNCGDFKYWVLNKYLFDSLVTSILLYGVEVYGRVTSLKPLEKSLKNVASILLYGVEVYGRVTSIKPLEKSLKMFKSFFFQSVSKSRNIYGLLLLET